MIGGLERSWRAILRIFLVFVLRPGVEGRQMKPELSKEEVTICRIVVYVLSAEDAEQINRRRTTGASIAMRPFVTGWPQGAQAHIGNSVFPGQHCPAMVVATRTVDEARTLVNLQVFLDGNDIFWAQNVENDGDKSPGTWHWPVRRAS